MAAVPAVKTSRLSTSGTTTPSQPKISTGLKLMSPATAQEILTRCQYSGQRALREWHVTEIQELMRTGHYAQGTTITYARIGPVFYLVNGQHTLTALSRLDGVLIWFEEKVHHVDTLAEVAALYETLDRFMPRSLRDLLHGEDFQGLSLKGKHFNLVSGACRYLINGFQQETGYQVNYASYRTNRDVQVRKLLIRNWAKEMDAFRKVCHGAEKFVREKVERAAVIAVALITLRYARPQAEEFWGQLIANNGLMRGDPRQALLNFLIRTPVRTLDAAVYPRCVAAAWNHWRNKKDLRELNAQSPQVRTTTEAIYIEGTPHDGEAPMGYVTAGRQVLERPIPLGTAVQNGRPIRRRP